MKQWLNRLIKFRLSNDDKLFIAAILAFTIYYFAWHAPHKDYIRENGLCTIQTITEIRPKRSYENGRRRHPVIWTHIYQGRAYNYETSTYRGAIDKYSYYVGYREFIRFRPDKPSDYANPKNNIVPEWFTVPAPAEGWLWDDVPTHEDLRALQDAHEAELAAEEALKNQFKDETDEE